MAKNAKKAKMVKISNIAKIAEISNTAEIAKIDKIAAAETKIWSFLKKKMGSSKTKLEFHSKSLKVVNLLYNANQMFFS